MISTARSRKTRPFLEVYQSGAVTRIGFAEDELPHFAEDAACREELLRIIRQNGCQRLVFELAGLRGVNSSLISLLLLPVRHGVEVVLAHPSRHLREVLRVTQVDRLLRITNSDYSASADNCAGGNSSAGRRMVRMRGSCSDNG